MEVPDYMHGNIQDILSCELDAAVNRSRWAVVYGLAPFKDGNQWCVLLGENLQEGISGFGATPHAAICAFDDAMHIKL